MRRTSRFDDIFYPYGSMDPEAARRRYAERDLDQETRQIGRAIVRTVLWLLLLFGGLAVIGAIPGPVLRATAPVVTLG